MPHRRHARKKASSRRRRAPWRARLARYWPSARAWRGAWRAFTAAPRAIQLTSTVLLVVALWALVNGAYQVMRKPTELFFPVSGVLTKTPGETWREYESIFRAHATEVITPELLAALAQLEGAGNPVATPPWQWYATWDLLELYRPASSAVGMYQITDGTFAQAKRYCIHNHRVVEEGPWYALRSCWFNGLYSRVVPSHATEMTAAYLDRQVADILRERNHANLPLRQQQDLAGVIHLCGAGAGRAYARAGFRLATGARCGAHDPRRYLDALQGLQREFEGYRLRRK